MPTEQEEKTPGQNDFGYMEELSKAYAEAFAGRLAGKNRSLSEEKRAAIAKMQAEISRDAGRIAVASREEEKKELARILKESAEEVLRVIGCDEEPNFVRDPVPMPSIAALLSRATLLANRCLNLLLRHREAEARPVFLILSELSALYAFAAIS